MADGMVKSSLRKLAILGMATGAVLAGFGLFTIYDANKKSQLQVQIITSSESFLSVMRDMETASRGFLIVGSERFLEPYDSALQNFPRVSEELAKVTQQNATASLAVQKLVSDAKAKWAFGNDIIAQVKQGHADAAKALVASGQGKMLMDRIRRDVADIQNAATQEIYRQQAQHLNWGLWLFAIAIGVLLASGLMFMLLARRAALAFRRVNSILTDILHRTPIGLALLSHDFKVLRANALFKAMLKNNYQHVVVIENVLPDAFIEHVKDDISAAHSQAPTQLLSHAKILEIANADGSFTYLQAEVFPVNSELHKSIHDKGVGLVLTDITAQKRWEIELEQARDKAEAANRAKSTFLANMSHELRTPLTAVLGYCELIEDDLADSGQDEVLSDLRKIRMNANHLLGLINDVLDLSKIEARKMDVHAIDFKLVDLLHELEATIAPLMKPNGNEFHIQQATDLPQMLHSDDLKIKQILVNLLGNAAKFTRQGKVSLALEPLLRDERPFIQFKVQDTGIGMTPEQVALMFERFSQADETTTRKFGGTGLGLSLTKALSEILGGDIQASSIVGEGTTLTVTLPVRYQAPQAPSVMKEVDPAAQVSLPDATGDTVLVIDDDAAARDYLQRLLTREKFKVVVAHDGPDGLHKAATLQPDVILLDVMMPGLDGWHVLRSLQAHENTRHIPVVMATVVDDERFAKSLGASHFLKKPINRERLLRVLNGSLPQRERGTVLIVDDDAEAIARLAQVMRKEGWQVMTAENGRIALQQVLAQRPDLMVVDLLMPDMDGFSLINEMRNRADLADIPIVVLTAADIREIRVRELRDRTDDILQKGDTSISALVSGLRHYMKVPS